MTHDDKYGDVDTYVFSMRLTHDGKYEYLQPRVNKAIPMITHAIVTR